jgi:hypothetical protein
MTRKLEDEEQLKFELVARDEGRGLAERVINTSHNLALGTPVVTIERLFRCTLMKRREGDVAIKR